MTRHAAAVSRLCIPPNMWRRAGLGTALAIPRSMNVLLLLIAAAPPLIDNSVPRERTYYNDAEANAERDREAAYLAADPTMMLSLEDERVRRFQLTPLVGMEVATLHPLLDAPRGTAGLVGRPVRVGFAPAYGLAADWRVGYFTVGARYQGSVFVDADPLREDLYLNKVYADVGFNVRAKILLFTGYLSGGYAFAATRDAIHHGVGGKAGIGFDFLITRAFSLGPGFSFDVHAYRPAGSANGIWLTSFGGTSQLRIAFHI